MIVCNVREPVKVVLETHTKWYTVKVEEILRKINFNGVRSVCTTLRLTMLSRCVILISYLGLSLSTVGSRCPFKLWSLTTRIIYKILIEDKFDLYSWHVTMEEFEYFGAIKVFIFAFTDRCPNFPCLHLQPRRIHPQNLRREVWRSFPLPKNRLVVLSIYHRHP